LSRRSLLGAAAAGAATAVLPAGCMRASASVDNGPIAAGNVSALTVDTLQVLDGPNVVIGRDAGGLYAMSAVCTHAGCVITTADAAGTVAAGLVCDCHGSRFDALGDVTHGPAGAPLLHYAVDVDSSGNITVHGDQPVAASTRTAA
jgi:cytochrome b6-f complex iron-sulfur subunit